MQKHSYILTYDDLISFSSLGGEAIELSQTWMVRQLK